MESNTVQQLRKIAKERGLKGYSRLKKADLVKLLEEPHGNEGGSLLDEDFEFDAPVLIPEKRKISKKEIPQVIEENVETFSDWLNWLENVKDESVKKKINPKVERLRKQIDNLWKTFQLKETKYALKNFTKQYTIDGETFNGGPKTFLLTVKPTLLQFLNEHRNIKLKLILKCIMSKTNIVTGEVEYTIGYFVSKVETILQGTNLDDLYQKMMGKMLESLAAYQMQGSNWLFDSIIALEVHTVKYEPLRGSSYIKLPDVLAKKKAIINMKNKDDECFKWCVTRALNPVTRDGERITKILRKQSEKLDWSGITFPLELKNIDRFEKQNETISVNVYGYEGRVYPLKISDYVYQPDRIHHVNLLLIFDGEKKHYCLIKSMSRLLSAQISKDQHKKFFCLRCLNPFGTQELLNKHEEYCSDNEAVRIEMPGENTVIGFKNHYRKIRHPFVIYADFESVIEPIDTTQPDPKKCYTNKIQMHKPSSFCYCIKSAFDESVYPTQYHDYIATSDDDDVAQKFVDSLADEIKKIYKMFKIPKKMIFKDEDRHKYKISDWCWICEGLFTDKDYKVRDHCHYTGKFRGAAHNSCNLKCKKPKFIPVVFHNLSGYDAHLFIRNLGVCSGNIKCIPKNEENYTSFTKEITVETFVDEDGEEQEVKRELRFIDSFKFMGTSLDNLVTNLASDNQKFENTRFFFPNQFELMLRKGVYPYEYMDSLDRLNEIQLPPKDKFFSKLSGAGISDEDYEHAKRVWSTFEMKTLRDYHKLYNKLDVFLLCDVFENFRDICITNYNLDPAYYYTAPGLSWDALLEKTKVNLELLSDCDMLLMIEHGIRGGISMISNRYGQANNIYMRELYDESKPDKYITYLDANNLYGWAMCKKLPVNGFKWMNEEELLNWRTLSTLYGCEKLHMGRDFKQVNENEWQFLKCITATYGCILEVDLEYPEELHDLHNDYPLAPERLVVNKVEKLIPNLNDKEKYVVYHENLKQYESLGLKIKKIHRGIIFRESDWMKEYIDLNTGLRACAANDFEKDFFKLMNNSVFGKTMENIRNRVDIQLVNSEEKAKRLAAKPNFKHCTIFSEKLCAINMIKKWLNFDKPVYIGMCILDRSKILMYDFHYNYILPKYGDKAKLLFTDTDSLAYEIETKDFYKDIADDITAKFDTSNFPKDHPSKIYTTTNKKVVGMFKDEAGGEQIVEFVGLRSKLYSYKMLSEAEDKKCKGVKKPVVKKSIKFDDYKKCLFGGGKQYRRMYNIRSHKHEVFTEELNKIALSANDDKRIIQSDKIHTLAYGHYELYT